jgi:hypothetical protein
MMAEYDLLSADGIKTIVASVIERAKENLAETEGHSVDYSAGYRMACYEFLDMIHSRVIIREGDLGEYGFDQDLESLLISDTKSIG